MAVRGRRAGRRRCRFLGLSALDTGFAVAADSGHYDPFAYGDSAGGAGVCAVASNSNSTSTRSSASIIAGDCRGAQSR